MNELMLKNSQNSQNITTLGDDGYSKNGENDLRVELDVQIATAQHYPRNITKVASEINSIISISPEIAESCYYTLERRGREGKIEKIEGASVRLAEICLSSWRNVHVATRIVSTEGAFLTAQAVAWDLEKNLRVITEVKRGITKKDGGRYSNDMIALTASAATSIALRNAVFKIIPKSIVDLAYKTAQKMVIDDKTFFQKREKVFEKLENLGAKRQDILVFFDKKGIEDFSADEVKDLIGIGTAIKEGLIKVEEAFLIEKDNARREAVSVEERVKGLIGEESHAEQ